MSDEKYTDRGHRGEDPRHGFGDDMGTRVAAGWRARGAARRLWGAAPGQPGTNADEVADGLEGSIMSDEGSEQRRVREASESVNPDEETGNDRRVFDL
jgi:hypothetical protein